MEYFDKFSQVGHPSEDKWVPLEFKEGRRTDQVHNCPKRKAAVDQKYVEKAPLLIVVCSNTSRSTGRYGIRGREFYSIIDGAFASMLILLSAVNEGIGAKKR
jgi:hypothetical protein